LVRSIKEFKGRHLAKGAGTSIRIGIGTGISSSISTKEVITFKGVITFISE
jgi:hypothetical protein